MEYPEITVESLKQDFKDQIAHEGITDEQLNELVRLIKNGEREGEDAVDDALNYFDNIFVNHGVEAINHEEASPLDVSYYHDIALLYSNTGETYEKTLAYDTELAEFVVTSWGDWFEGFEQEKDIRYDDDGYRIYSEDESEDDLEDDSEELEEEFNRQFTKSYSEYLAEEDEYKRDLINDEAFNGDDWSEEDDEDEEFDLKRLMESGDIVECPSCGAYNAFAWDYSNMDANAPSRDPESWLANIKEDIYHIPASSAWEWTCGKCKTSYMEKDSPLNHPAYTHGDGDDDYLDENQGVDRKFNLINEEDLGVDEENEEQDELNLDSIPDKEVIITVPMDRLCKVFEYSSPEDIVENNRGSFEYVSIEGLEDVTGLYITKCDDLDDYEDWEDEEREIFEENGWCFMDRDDKVLDWGVVEEIQQAVNDAYVYGTESNIYKSIKNALESVFENFQNYDYHYDALDDDGYVYCNGRANGFISIDFEEDPVQIKVHSDFIHVINDCIAGVGMFEVDYGLEGEGIDEYINGRWEHIRHYGEIYGTGFTPEASFDAGFDDKFFREEISKIEQQHGYNLTHKPLGSQSRNSSEDDELNEEKKVEGEKLFKIQDNIGKAKYTVSFHDGIKTHKDGSPFYDIKTFSDKKKRDAFVKELKDKGYKEE